MLKIEVLYTITVVFRVDVAATGVSFFSFFFHMTSYHTPSNNVFVLCKLRSIKGAAGDI